MIGVETGQAASCDVGTPEALEAAGGSRPRVALLNEFPVGSAPIWREVVRLGRCRGWPIVSGHTASDASHSAGSVGVGSMFPSGSQTEASNDPSRRSVGGLSIEPPIRSTPSRNRIHVGPLQWALSSTTQSSKSPTNDTRQYCTIKVAGLPSIRSQSAPLVQMRVLPWIGCLSSSLRLRSLL